MNWSLNGRRSRFKSKPVINLGHEMRGLFLVNGRFFKLHTQQTGEKEKERKRTGKRKVNRKRDLGPGSLFSWAETERNFMGTMAVLQPNVTQPPVKIGQDAQLVSFLVALLLLLLLVAVEGRHRIPVPGHLIVAE
jgi:hypothetical protein